MREKQIHNTVTTVLTEQRSQHCTEGIPRGHNKEIKKGLDTGWERWDVCVCVECNVTIRHYMSIELHRKCLFFF